MPTANEDMFRLTRTSFICTPGSAEYSGVRSAFCRANCLNSSFSVAKGQREERLRIQRHQGRLERLEVVQQIEFVRRHGKRSNGRGAPRRRPVSRKSRFGATVRSDFRVRTLPRKCRVQRVMSRRRQQRAERLVARRGSARVSCGHRVDAGESDPRSPEAQEPLQRRHRAGNRRFRPASPRRRAVS